MQNKILLTCLGIIWTFSSNTQVKTTQYNSTIDTVSYKVDSLQDVKDSINNTYHIEKTKAETYSIALSKGTDQLKKKVSVLSSLIDSYKKKKPDTIYRSKVIYTPVNKSEYYIEQKRITDSVAKLKK